MGIAVVTTVSRNYLGLARVLMKSVALHHPDAERIVLLLDAEVSGTESIPGVTMLSPADLVPDERERLVQQAMYRPIEYATALKPKLLLHALATADQAFFVDPDMRLFQPLDDAQAALADRPGVLLTPHRLTPPDHAERVFFEWTFKAYGVYNTAFVGVTAADRPFLLWWDDRLRRDCIADLAQMEWVDQRIVDLASGYFPVQTLRHPGYNVAWWNLVERPVERADDRWLAGGEPLVVMHYSGVHPKRGFEPPQLSDLPQLAHAAENPIVRVPGQIDLLWVLEEEYKQDLVAEGYAQYATQPYGLTRTPAGRRLSDGDRARYRQVVLAAEAAGDPAPLPDDIPWGAPTRAAAIARTLETPRGMLHDFARLRRSVRSLR